MSYHYEHCVVCLEDKERSNTCTVCPCELCKDCLDAIKGSSVKYNCPLCRAEGTTLHTDTEKIEHYQERFDAEYPLAEEVFYHRIEVLDSIKDTLTKKEYHRRMDAIDYDDDFLQFKEDLIKNAKLQGIHFCEVNNVFKLPPQAYPF